jgi:CRISPR system Cascade subunit CasE
MNLTNVAMTHPAFADGRWGDASWQHRAVMSLFGDLGSSPAARTNGQVLFRVEPDALAPAGTVGRVLVQSAAEPTAHGIRVTSLAPVFAAYAPGVTVRLLLRANTVRTINRTHTDGKVRRHRARIPDGELEGWLNDRLGGAVLLHSTVLAEPGELRRGKAQLITTTYRTDATVTNPQVLARLVRDGVGRAKAYGCGMLSALPVR